MRREYQERERERERIPEPKREIELLNYLYKCILMETTTIKKKNDEIYNS